MFDVITFGSATRDVILRSDGFEEIKEEKKFLNKKGVFFSLGSKIPISEIEFLSGGGGTNTAFTFKIQGFKVAYCGFVGSDYAGEEIKGELKKKKISTNFLYKTNKKHTNYSVIIITKSDRTALVYKGASECLREENIPWKCLEAKWFYLAPLSGSLSKLTEKLLKFAKKQEIKIAINPGNSQLSLSREKKKKLFNLADVVILNQEEASLATNLPGHKEKEIFSLLDEWVGGVVVMTKGPLGAVVSDGKFIYEAGILPVKKIVDRTGCGDAFGSGFTVGLIRKMRNRKYIRPEDIEYAIQYGSANAASCIQELGAKRGLLRKKDSIWKFGKIKIKKTPLKK